MNIGIMEADIDSDVDAERISNTGVKKVIQLHTGGMCHLDADMTRQGLTEMGTDDLDLVVLENVGNLVCPAEFDTGAAKNAMILSVPEGRQYTKYPLIFGVCDALIINKIDVLPYFDFDMDKVVEFAKMRNQHKNIPDKRKNGRGRGRVVCMAARAGRHMECALTLFNKTAIIVHLVYCNFTWC